MLKKSDLEPGVLPVFRSFMVIELAIYLLRAGKHIPHGDFGRLLQGFRESPWIFPIDIIVLVICLSWPRIQNKLGRAFLPIMLVIATVGPMLRQYLILSLESGMYELYMLVGVWQMVVILFIPLVLIAWQYDFRAVLLFCGGTALLDIALLLFVGNDLLDIEFAAWTAEIPLLASISIAGAAFIRTLSFLIVGYMVTRIMATQREQRQDLFQANTKLANYASALEQLTVSHERNRLARELHDTLAHTLSGVSVQLEAAKALWDTDQEKAYTILKRSLSDTRQGLTETRRALQDLRASQLEDLGLSLAIRNLAEAAAERIGLKLDISIPDRLEGIPPEIAQCIYRTSQEALANIDRHAGAKKVSIRLDLRNRGLILVIADDGIGFNPSDVDAARHYGIRGMRERAEIVGGKLEVESEEDQGTTVRLVLEEI